jgi:hypothetical protein
MMIQNRKNVTGPKCVCTGPVAFDMDMDMLAEHEHPATLRAEAWRRMLAHILDYDVVRDWRASREAA